MSEHAESVKKLSAYFYERSRHAKESGRDSLSSKLEDDGDKLANAYDHMLDLEALTTALPPDLGNIHDLPQELVKELSVINADALEDQIVTVINSYGGTASLDQILVGLYRKFKVIQKRRFMQNKLYRMSMVWSIAGRKGVYTTTKPKEVPSNEEPDFLSPDDDSEVLF